MSELPQWSIFGAVFYPISGDREIPRWKRTLRVQVENLVGTGLAEFNLFGLMEFRMTGDWYVPTEIDYGNLISNLGSVGPLITGSTEWDNVILLTEDLKQTKGGWEGTLEFGMSGSA